MHSQLVLDCMSDSKESPNASSTLNAFAALYLTFGGFEKIKLAKAFPQLFADCLDFGLRQPWFSTTPKEQADAIRAEIQAIRDNKDAPIMDKFI